MSSSVASGYSSKVGRSHQRKYNIAPELLASPYLSRPIGSFNHDEKKKRRTGSPREERGKPKSPRLRREERDYYASDVESVVTRTSVKSYRTRGTYHRPSPNNSRRLTTIKNCLLPRELDKILRGFRQRHNNHPILKNQTARSRHKSYKNDDDDDSTIASDSAESLDDEAVYLHCLKDEDVNHALFSGPLFAEITLRNARHKVEIEGADQMLTLPPVVSNHDDKSDEVSDLESQHSSASKLISECNVHAVKPCAIQRKKRR